jgi:hypothetical protein
VTVEEAAPVQSIALQKRHKTNEIEHAGWF